MNSPRAQGIEHHAADDPGRRMEINDFELYGNFDRKTRPNSISNMILFLEETTGNEYQQRRILTHNKNPQLEHEAK